MRVLSSSKSTLTWDRIDLYGDPPTIQVWRSVRRGGELKTIQLRRTLELPNIGVGALRDHLALLADQRLRVGDAWVDLGLVFCTQGGSSLDAANVRRSFRQIAGAAGLDPRTGRRASCGTVLSPCCQSSGVAIEDIAHLVGHGSTNVAPIAVKWPSPTKMVRLRPGRQGHSLALVSRCDSLRSPWTVRPCGVERLVIGEGRAWST